MEYDYIIIGGGIAALYYAYKTGGNYLIIEKRPYAGGRIRSAKLINGRKIQIGAGVIRTHDANVMALLKELGIDTIKSKGAYRHHAANITKEDAHKLMSQVKDMYYSHQKEIDASMITFSEYLEKYFGLQFKEHFINLADYNDFLEADVRATIEEYPWNELITVEREHYLPTDGETVGWSCVVDRLLKDIKNIKLSEKVISVDKKPNYFRISTNIGLYVCKKLIIAADITAANINYSGLEPTAMTQMASIYSHIGGMPFFCVYSEHDESNIKTSIRTTNELMRIIPMDKTLNLCCYSDNHNAVALYDRKKRTSTIKNHINNLLQQSLMDDDKVSPIKNIYMNFWNIGVHYYKPHTVGAFDQTALNANGIFICGEMVSHSQGWVEGAISSVNELIN